MQNQSPSSVFCEQYSSFPYDSLSCTVAIGVRSVVLPAGGTAV